MLLANYDYHVVYPGKSNANADGLSHTNELPADDVDMVLATFALLQTPAVPDLPVCLDVFAMTAAP